MSESSEQPTGESNGPSSLNSGGVGASRFRTEAERSAQFTADRYTSDMHDRVDNDFGYHKATGTTGPMHDETRAKFAELAHWVVDNIPRGRDQSLCITALEDALMRANKAIATTLSPLEG